MVLKNKQEGICCYLAPGTASVQVQPWCSAIPWPWTSTRTTGWPRTWASQGSAEASGASSITPIPADLKGVQLCLKWVACHGAAQGVQGQAGPQIHQESGGDTYWCQEEAREMKSVLASMRETAAKRIEPPPCSVHNKIFIEKKKT